MRPLHLATAFLSTVLITGCATTSFDPHDRTQWVPHADIEKATADWDVAEGICDKLASGAQLTEEEKALVEQEKEMNDFMAKMLFDQSELMRLTDDTGALSGLADNLAIAGGVVKAFGAFSASTAEEDKKGKTFLECMDKLGWKQRQGN